MDFADNKTSRFVIHPEDVAFGQQMMALIKPGYLTDLNAESLVSGDDIRQVWSVDDRYDSYQLPAPQSTDLIAQMAEAKPYYVDPPPLIPPSQVAASPTRRGRPKKGIQLRQAGIVDNPLGNLVAEVQGVRRNPRRSARKDRYYVSDNIIDDDRTVINTQVSALQVDDEDDS